MRNIIITLILFSSITTVNFLSVSYLNKIYTNVKDTNCSIMQLINDENWSAAKKHLKNSLKNGTLTLINVLFL